MKIQNKRLKSFLCIVIAVLSFITVIFLLFKFRSIFNIIIISFICAYFVKPLYRKMTSFKKINKRIAAIIIILMISVFFILTIYFTINTLYKEWSNIGSVLDDADKMLDMIKMKLGINNEFIDTAINNLQEQINYSVSRIVRVDFEKYIEIGENILGIAIIPLLMYYFLIDGNKIFARILNLFRPEYRQLINKISFNIDCILEKYIFSQFMLSMIVSILTFLVLFIIGVPLPMLLGALNGLFNLVPYFGPVIGAIPAIVVALIKSKSAALWTVVCIFIIQQIEGNILSPLITAYSVKIHPITVIILLLIGEKIGGIAGMILAVPLGVVVKQILDDINYYLY